MSWRHIVFAVAATACISSAAGAAEVLSFDSPALSIYTAPSASDRLCLVLDVRNKAQRPVEVTIRYEIQRIGATAGLRLTETRDAVLQIRPGGQAIEPLPSAPRCDALATVTVQDVQVKDIDPATHPALAEPGGVFGPGANSYESGAVSIRAIRSPSNGLCHALDVRNKKDTPIEVLIRYDENYVAVTAGMRISTPLDASIQMRPGAQMIEEVRSGVDCHPQAVLSIREVQVKDLDAAANPKLATPEGVFGSGSTTYESAILSIKTLRNPQNTLCQALSVENKTSGLLKVLIRWEERYIDVTTGMRLERPSYTFVDIRGGDRQIQEIATAPSCHPSAVIVLTEVTVEQKDANAVVLPQRAPSSVGGFFAQSIAEADAAQRQRDWEAAQRELQLAQERRRREAEADRLAAEQRKRDEEARAAQAFRDSLGTMNPGQLFAKADELAQSDKADSREVLRALITRFPDHKLAEAAAEQMAGGLQPSSATGGSANAQARPSPQVASSAAPAQSTSAQAQAICALQDKELEIEFTRLNSEIPASDNVGKLRLLANASLLWEKVWLPCNKEKAKAYYKTFGESASACRAIATNINTCSNPHMSLTVNLFSKRHGEEPCDKRVFSCMR